MGSVVEIAPGPGAHGDSGRIELVGASILDADAVRASTRACQVVVHLAANTGVAPSIQDPRRDCMVNVIGTLNCLEAARHEGVERFVFACPPRRSARSRHRCTRTRRAMAGVAVWREQLAGEGYCSTSACSFGVETVALRFGNVLRTLFGPQEQRGRCLHQARPGRRAARDLW